MKLVVKTARLLLSRSGRRVLTAQLLRRPDRHLHDVDLSVRDAVVRSGLFDPDFYEYRHSDTRAFPGGTIRHFVRYGLSEAREASPVFSVTRYLADHPELKKSGIPPFLDAISRHDRATLMSKWPADDDWSLAYLLTKSGLFDPKWYIEQNADVAAARLDPLDHFVSRGALELRDPGPGFDSAFYQYAYRDFRLTGRSPIESYLRHGRHSGRKPQGESLYALWRSRFATLESHDRDRIAEAVAAQGGAMAGVLIANRETASNFSRLLQSWVDQIGIGWSVRVVRAAELGDEAWAECVAAVDTQPSAEVRDAAHALADLAPGTLVVLGTGACILEPHAAAVFTHRLRSEDVLAAYADHDRIDETGRCSGPIFKPAMSPEFMRRLPYAGPVVAARLEPAREAIMRAASSDGARAFATILLDLDPARILRIPFILYHLAEPVSVEKNRYLEPAPASAGTHHLPIERLVEPPRVAVIIPTRDYGDLVRECIESIQTRTEYPADRISFVVVDNGTTDAETLALFDDYRQRSGFTIVPVDEVFNFSKLCNAGAAATDADILIFLNNDTTVHRADWLLRLVEQASKPEVGLVGAQLLYPDLTVQHGGVALGVQGVGAHRLIGLTEASAGAIDVTREMTSLTGACLAVRRSVFEELNGFDPILRVAFNDVDLCARSVEAGYKNIYVAEPLIIHHESKSRGLDLTRAAKQRNLREAIFTRQRHTELFRNDPSYSPNLSMTHVGALGFPPRVARPWRRSHAGKRRILLLSIVHGLGHGVATVVAEQAALLIGRGWDVTIGGPPAKREMPYPGCRRVHLWDAVDAACYAVAEGLDCVMAHTPPFFSIVRHLGAWPLVFVTDHGEPMPHLFDDREHREDVDWEKRFCAPLAHRVFVISRSIYAQQYRRDAVVIRNGNSHLAGWTERHAADRSTIRERLGFSGRFVVLNVCRFGAGERRYKGIDHYGAVASDLPYLHPELQGRVVFVLAGRGDDQDIEHAKSIGLTVFANVTDAELIDLYVAADLYMNLSAWEGYNLGIGQGLAMGLDVIASDIDAHREFGIETTNSVPDLCAAVARRATDFDETAAGRSAVIHPWSEPLTRMAETIETDLDSAPGDWRM